jgi:hypothetical protein
VWFTDEETAIFCFEVPGGVKRYADPNAVWRVLVAETGGQLDAIQDRYDQGEADPRGSSEAALALHRAACAAFGLEPFDRETGSGVVESVSLKILDGFYAWSEDLKKNGVTTSMSSPPSDGPPAARPATNSGTPCGCP